MKNKSIWASGAIAVFLACAWAMSGCFLLLGAGAGAGGYSYIRGELSKEYPRPIDATWQATHEALKDLELAVQTQTKDGLGGRLEAQRADGTKISIAFAVKSANVTAVGVRVGLMGDRAASERIHAKISAHLGGQ